MNESLSVATYLRVGVLIVVSLLPVLGKGDADISLGMNYSRD